MFEFLVERPMSSLQSLRQASILSAHFRIVLSAEKKMYILLEADEGQLFLSFAFPFAFSFPLPRIFFLLFRLLGGLCLLLLQGGTRDR